MNTAYVRGCLYPAKVRYCECVVGCAIFEDAIEVIGDDFVEARIHSGRRHVLWHGNVAEWQQDNSEQERRSGSGPQSSE
jgi:hypothetical protein